MFDNFKCMVAAVAATVVVSSPVWAETRVTYKSAKTGSSYYQMGVELSEAMKSGTDGDIIVTVEESQGSVQNVMEVRARGGAPPARHRCPRGGRPPPPARLAPDPATRSPPTPSGPARPRWQRASLAGSNLPGCVRPSRRPAARRAGRVAAATDLSKCSWVRRRWVRRSHSDCRRPRRLQGQVPHPAGQFVHRQPPRFPIPGVGPVEHAADGQ